MVRCGRVNREENQDFCSLQAASTRTIIRIIPVYLVILVIVEFHALDDMITEPDTDIGVRLYLAWRCRRTSADIDPLYRAKAGRKIDLIGRSALNPGPAETLSDRRARTSPHAQPRQCRLSTPRLLPLTTPPSIPASIPQKLESVAIRSVDGAYAKTPAIYYMV